MDEQANPMMPVPSEPMPVSPPATPSPKPASSMRVVWMALGGVVVLAGAAYGWMRLNPAAPATESPTPTSTTTATADPTAGWKTYTNTQYGFEVKYPNDWELTKDKNNQTVLRFSGTNPPVSSMTISFGIVSLGTSVGIGGAHWKPTVFAGKSAYIWDRSSEIGGPVRSIVAPLYAGSVDANSKELRIDTLANVAIVDQILSTFKFTK